MSKTKKRLFQISIGLNMILILFLVWGINRINFVKEQILETEVRANLVQLEGVIANQVNNNWSEPNLVTTELNSVLNGIWLGMTTGDQLGTLSKRDEEVFQKLYFKLNQYPHNEQYKFAELTEKDKENFEKLREMLRNAELGLNISLNSTPFIRQAEKLEKTIHTPLNELP